MADKFPLIANTSAQQIQEISSGDNLNLLGNSIVGVVSVTSSGNISVGGTLSVTGNVSVGGTLTYEDVTNVDSVGVITARSNILVGGFTSQTVDTAKIVVKSAGSNIGIIHVCSDAGETNGDLSGIAFSHGGFGDPGNSTSAARAKAAIALECGSGGYGRGDLCFYVDGAGDNNNVAAADKVVSMSSSGMTVTGTISDDKGNLRNIPQNSQSSAYTLVAADAGKHVYISSGGVTIPASIFSTGDAITIINNSGSDQTITCSAVTTYLAGDTSTKSSLTLKGRGIATFLFASATVCYGSGAGLE